MAKLLCSLSLAGAGCECARPVTIRGSRTSTTLRRRRFASSCSSPHLGGTCRASRPGSGRRRTKPSGGSTTPPPSSGHSGRVHGSGRPTIRRRRTGARGSSCAALGSEPYGPCLAFSATTGHAELGRDVDNRREIQVWVPGPEVERALVALLSKTAPYRLGGRWAMLDWGRWTGADSGVPLVVRVVRSRERLAALQRSLKRQFDPLPEVNQFDEPITLGPQAYVAVWTGKARPKHDLRSTRNPDIRNGVFHWKLKLRDRRRTAEGAPAIGAVFELPRTKPSGDRGARRAALHRRVGRERGSSSREPWSKRCRSGKVPACSMRAASTSGARSTDPSAAVTFPASFAPGRMRRRLRAFLRTLGD